MYDCVFPMYNTSKLVPEIVRVSEKPRWTKILHVMSTTKVKERDMSKSRRGSGLTSVLAASGWRSQL